MGLIKEPKGVDLIVESEPWTEKDLADFRKLMKEKKQQQEKEKKETLSPTTE
jgi:hypothetical protein